MRRLFFEDAVAHELKVGAEDGVPHVEDGLVAVVADVIEVVAVAAFEGYHADILPALHCAAALFVFVAGRATKGYHGNYQKKKLFHDGIF